MKPKFNGAMFWLALGLALVAFGLIMLSRV